MQEVTYYSAPYYGEEIFFRLTVFLGIGVQHCWVPFSKDSVITAWLFAALHLVIFKH